MVEIPEWLNKEAWEDFIKFRKEIKAKMTERAQELAIKKLDQWRKKGHDPTEIINASIMNSWRGLFEPKSKVNGKQCKYDPAAATVASITARMDRAPIDPLYEQIRTPVYESDNN